MVRESVIEDEYDEEEAGQGSIDTAAATAGSEPLLPVSGISLNPQAALPTVIIKPPRPKEGKHTPPLSESDELSSSAEHSESDIPPDGRSSPENVGAPPAYTNSVRTKRASYAARNVVHGPGTILSQADIGTGVDTIRPIKKVDAAGSIRVSAEFVGREGSLPSSPSSPSKEPYRRSVSEVANAGKSLVDDVILPLLRNVSGLVLSRTSC
jgi:serine/threonine-protein kinase 24/25/MST4